MDDAALIGVDWGSTSVRAFAIGDDGTILAARRADDGVFSRPGDFEARLTELLSDWPERLSNAPILLCGMVGSDRGWAPAPYVPAPAGLADLAGHLLPVRFSRPAYIVPGVSFVDGDAAEVMRGEETITVGLDAGHATICLPGTHSKWIDIDDGRIVGFRTYMTGELRALLLADGALASDAVQVVSNEAFARGLTSVRDNASVTRALFQARARRLLGRLPAPHTASFVGGVLIGEEIACEAERQDGPIILAARDAIAEAYATALAQAGRSFELADPEAAAARGLLRIARAKVHLE